MQYTKNYSLKKPEGTDVVDVNDININADIIDNALTPTADSTQAPLSNGPAKISQWVSWITNRIKAITGKANWYDAPDTSLSDIVTTAAPNKVLKLDGNAKLPASITGDAHTLDGKNASDFAAANHEHPAPANPISVRTGTIPDQGIITATPGYAYHQYFVSLSTINGYGSPFDIPIEQRGIYPYFKNVAVDTTRVGYICTIDQSLRVTARVLADNDAWISGTANYMEIAWN